MIFLLLERQLTIKDLSSNFNIRELLKYWYIPKKWQHLIRIQKGFLINDVYHPFNTIIHNGDKIKIKFSTDIVEQHYLPAKKITFKTIYENHDLLIVNKPANLKTHPNRPDENNTLYNQVQTYFGRTPLMLHRLDMKTSGLIMIAKDPIIVPIIERQLAKKEMQRYYIAVTQYNPNISQSGVIDQPIGFDPTDKRKRKVDPDNGLKAVTKYRILKHNDQFALVKLELLSGRTHQIRVHLNYIGLSIIGDPLYSNIKANRMYLHAYKMKYTIPFSKNIKEVKTNIPNEFLQKVTFN